MSDDAKFEDGTDKPLKLWAGDAEDLNVISTLVQDAIFPLTEMSWRPSKRQFAILLNRFRWEDSEFTRTNARDYERVQSVLEISDVTSVRASGIDQSQTDMVLSLLSIEWTAGEDGTGSMTITLAGDGAFELSVECIDARLTDVTRPYRAPSGKRPEHS